jgi:hypothetical protein
MLTYYYVRILKDKLKLLIIALIALDVLGNILAIALPYLMWSDWGFENAPKAIFTPFLAAYPGVTMLLNQIILFWFIPIYMLLITADDSFEDRKTHLITVLISKIGYAGYYVRKVCGAFLMGFGLLFIVLLINLFLCLIIFRSGTDQFMMDDSPENVLYTWSFHHPILANFIFIFTTSFLVGTISAAGTALAIIIHDRRIVYPLTFAIWFIPSCLDKSLMLAVQVFSEYDFNTILPVYCGCVALYLGIAIGGYFACVRNRDVLETFAKG